MGLHDTDGKDETSKLHEAIERLSLENARHRVISEELFKILRMRAGKDTDGLKLTEALRVVLDQRDTLRDKAEKAHEAFINIRGMLLEGRYKAAVEFAINFLKK